MDTSKQLLSIFWFRRDLRLHDNVGLYHALKSGTQVQPIFIFDASILDKLSDKTDARVSFIYQTIANLKNELQTLGADLWVFHGEPLAVFEQLLLKYQLLTVFCNRDYEPYAIARDKAIFQLLASKNVALKGYKDQVIFDKNDVLKPDSKPYTVFTPYKNKWMALFSQQAIAVYPINDCFNAFNQTSPTPLLSLADLGFEKSAISVPPPVEINNEFLDSYAKRRDLPADAATSRLSVHLRFGTVSIRALASQAFLGEHTWLNELIWRDFYHMILYHFPHSATAAFKPAYDCIPWRTSEADFEKWCAGKTGYPLVDAGMRELNATGFMHNRVRMVVASFLTKHLLIDWRWGEAYFAQKLLDYDMAANVGGWQWAASTGCDAAPYFRIFNPEAQFAKFDPKAKYVKKWVPEFGSNAYVKPMVAHEFARKRALETYKFALQPLQTS